MKLKTRCSKKNVQLDGSSTFMVIVLPKGSLYDMFTYSWLMFMDVYGTLVVRYTIHGSYGLTCVFWIKGNLQVWMFMVI